MAAAAAAAAVETRPLPQVGSLGIAARAQPRPTSPFQSRPQTRLLPSLRRGPRRGREPDADREATPPQGLARAPLPLQKTHPSLGAERAVEAFPDFWKGKPQCGGGLSARGLSEVAPLWLLGAAQIEGGSCRRESRSPFCLSAEIGGRNCRQTPTSPEALCSIPSPPRKELPQQPFFSHSSRCHPSAPSGTFLFLTQRKESLTLFLCMDLLFV